MREIIFSHESLQDLLDIELYISKDNPIIAEKVVNSIILSTHNLVMFPELGVKRSDIYREIIDPIYKYNIRYKIQGNIIYVMTIYKYQDK